MNIYVLPDDLRKQASEIRLTKATIETTFNQIEALVLSLNSYQGLSAQSYVAKLSYIRQLYGELLACVEDYATLLDKSADEYEQFESGVVLKINLT